MLLSDGTDRSLYGPSYDVWSAGLVILEMMLGQHAADVLRVTAKDELKVRHAHMRLRHGSIDSTALRQELLEAGLANLCLSKLTPLHPGVDVPHDPSSSSSSSSRSTSAGAAACTFERFRELLHQHDEYASTDKLDPAVTGDNDVLGGSRNNDGTPLGYMGACCDLGSWAAQG